MLVCGLSESTSRLTTNYVILGFFFFFLIIIIISKQDFCSYQLISLDMSKLKAYPQDVVGRPCFLSGTDIITSVIRGESAKIKSETTICNKDWFRFSYLLQIKINFHKTVKDARSNLCLNANHFKNVNFKFELNWPNCLDVRSNFVHCSCIYRTLLCKLKGILPDFIQKALSENSKFDFFLFCIYLQLASKKHISPKELIRNHFSVK